MPTETQREYETAVSLAQQGQTAKAEEIYQRVASSDVSRSTRAIVFNDRGVLAAINGELDLANSLFEAAVDLDAEFRTARDNLKTLGFKRPPTNRTTFDSAQLRSDTGRTRVAILSLLFNWPSTGGGTIHTAETGVFLGRAGYEVRHIYAHFPAWGLGKIEETLDTDLQPLHFEPESWNAPEIQRRFRKAVDEFAPDFVIITDSWNFKVLLAEAMHGYRYFLRLAALECLCPLNNVRLLVSENGLASCPKHQLAVPDACRACVSINQQRSGQLHQLERNLSGFESSKYVDKLRSAFADAEAVLVVNPLIAAMVGPYAKQVRVVPSGFDAARFPPNALPVRGRRREKKTIFFAGLVAEYIKGFAVLHEACSRLWQRRQDFELVATAEPVGQIDAFTRNLGWLSQSELPQELHQADLLVFPTIAEEALGRSAVEAMAAGVPVIASRIGGLQFTVSDEGTGLLFEPGNVIDLERQIERLLDSPELRWQFGQAGRRRFEEEFTWEHIVERHYRPLLGNSVKDGPRKTR